MTEKVVSSAEWSTLQTSIGETVAMTATLSGDEAAAVVFTVYEYSGPQYPLQEVTSKTVVVDEDQMMAEATWTVALTSETASTGGVPEYRFKAVIGSSSRTSSTLKLGEIQNVEWEPPNSDTPQPPANKLCYVYYMPGETLGLRIEASGLQGFLADFIIKRRDRLEQNRVEYVEVDRVEGVAIGAAGSWMPPSEGDDGTGQYRAWVELRHPSSGVTYAPTPDNDRTQLACRLPVEVEVTNLDPGDIIAMTDGNFVTPQPKKDTDPLPESQKLIIEGTVQGWDEVEVNGEAAAVTGSTWRIELPIEQPGELELVVRAAHVERRLTVHLITLLIESPEDEEVFELAADPPAMPDIPVQVKLEGYPQGAPSNVKWTLELGGKYINRSGWHDYLTESNGQSNTTRWEITPSEFHGGWAKLKVTVEEADIKGGKVTSPPRWFDVQGANADQSTVVTYARRQIANDHDKNLFEKILCHESLGHAFVQFREEAEHREPTDKRAGISTPAPMRPVFGAAPSGIGIAQLDPAEFPEEQWNWRENVSRAAAIHEYNRRQAGHLPRREQNRVDYERRASVRLVNEARRNEEPPLPPINLDRDQVPALNNVSEDRETIRRYNGGRNYRFDRQYVLTEDGLNVRVVGSGNWTQDPGFWEDADDWQARGGVKVLRKWHRVSVDRLSYVDDVLGCSS